MKGKSTEASRMHLRVSTGRRARHLGRLRSPGHQTPSDYDRYQWDQKHV